ncbi:MAG: 2-methylcitrate dehydratase PrpD [Gammaproteobacteria bacterium]|jgi:2-methylcitrate dehydratase PrpD
MTNPSYTEQFAVWANQLKYAQLPEAVSTDAKLRVLDILGTTLAASSFTSSASIRDGALKIAAGDEARILGHGHRASVTGAALANGTMAHALDYDDTHLGSVVHISAPVVTTALTLGEKLKAPGDKVLEAIVVGAEMGCRIGSVAPKAFHQQGFHATAVVGTFAAALTAAKLLNLNDKQTACALGIAGSQSSGIMQCFNDGTWAKQFHVGWSAHSGIIAAHLAQCGFTGPSEVLEGIQGFYKTHTKLGEQFPERLMDGLGARWEYPATSFKPYPCGHVVHGFLDCVTQLYHEQGLRAEEVASMTCPIAEWMIPIMCEPREVKLRPATDYHAKFSFPFTIAVTLSFGRLGVEAFSDENIHDPAILALTDKIMHEVDPTANDPTRFKGWVQVETTDGRKLERVVTDNWGSESNPMTPEQVRTKFRDNAQLVLDEATVDSLVEQVENMDALDDVSQIVSRCIKN